MHSPEDTSSTYVPSPGFELPTHVSDEHIAGLEGDISLLKEQGKLTPIQVQVLERGLSGLREQSPDDDTLIVDCRSKLQWYDTAVVQGGNSADKRHFDVALIDDAVALFERQEIGYKTDDRMKFLSPATYFLLQTLFQKA